jgi:hypothetical protein
MLIFRSVPWQPLSISTLRNVHLVTPSLTVHAQNDVVFLLVAPYSIPCVEVSFFHARRRRRLSVPSPRSKHEEVLTDGRDIHFHPYSELCSVQYRRMPLSDHTVSCPVPRKPATKARLIEWSGDQTTCADEKDFT